MDNDFISIQDCCKLYNVDRKTFDTYCIRFNIETIKEKNNTFISNESKTWFDNLFNSYDKNDIKSMLLSNIKPFSCKGITYLNLRKQLNLTLKQFVNKISHIGLELKSNYTAEEENKIREFCSNGMNKVELKEIDYVNQGYIPLRMILKDINVSKGTLTSYVDLLKIEVYKPSHELSFITESDKEKILNFINEHNDSNERKIYLSKQTCLKKYGVENGAKNEDIKNKISINVKKTCTKERTEKICKSKLKRYGKKSITNYEKANQTKIDKYGTISINHKYVYDNLNFDSSWELYFYIYHKEILKDNITRGRFFEYYFENKKHIYECDFKIDNENYEIKGSQYLDKNNNLYFPYINDKKVNVDKLKKLWNAKSKCMIENNVKIISEKEITNIVRLVDEQFTNDYVNLFRVDLSFPYINDNFEDKSDMGLIHHFHKSIYEATRKGKLSPVKAWEDKFLIKKSALNRLKYVGSCKPLDIVQGFNVSKIAPKISVFKPKFAERILMKYSTTNVVFDPFSGFSGRMIASVNLNKFYIGRDINEKHVRESNEIISYKEYKNCTVSVQDIMTDYERDYSDVTLFTCPPYGGKEHWNENNDEVEKTCDEWIDICLKKYKCKEYIFVVDETEKYKKYVVEIIENKSHFGKNNEYVLYIS